MAYARPFGQQQAASPWSAGVPPGLQQPAPQAQPPAQQMFSQPMGPFDLSAAWQQAQPQQAQVPPPQVPGPWAQAPMQPMQAPMQFVPNSGAFMQPMQMQHHQQQRYNQQMQQRVPHHQRSLSAPRIGGGQNNKRAGNQNNSFGGGQRQFNNNHSNNNNNSNNNQRANRQQARQGNQKVQFSNNNNNTNNNFKNNNTNNNNYNNKQQNQKQQQQQQQNQQQQTKGPVKVTKAAKKQALANANRGSVQNNNSKAINSTTSGGKSEVSANGADEQQKPKLLSKTAERKQLKLQARKNAEALDKSSVPVVKTTKTLADRQAAAKVESQMDQNQMKCVPAVFGFVCKVCDVFLRDRAARLEHISLPEHLQNFKVFDEEQQKLAPASKSEEVKSEKAVDNSDQITSEMPAETLTGDDAKVEPSVDASANANVTVDANAEPPKDEPLVETESQ